MGPLRATTRHSGAESWEGERFVTRKCNQLNEINLYTVLSYITILAFPLPHYAIAANPTSMALHHWRLSCIAANCEPCIITTAQSTDKVFHLRDDLETAGLTFSQTLKEVKLTTQHSFMAEHNLQWVSLPQVTMHAQYTAQKWTIKVGSCFESLFCPTIKFRSIPVQCLSCFDTCQPMHSPMSTVACPRHMHGFCKLCSTPLGLRGSERAIIFMNNDWPNVRGISSQKFAAN